jgi:uncharacterized membrane protein
MDRHSLDAFCAQHALGTAAVHKALTLAGQRPNAGEWREFAATLLRGAGLGALGAGVIFFVAANWQDWGLMGRFALLQLALLVAVAVALWRPPPHRLGQAAMMLAVLLVGALLALFGQSYQTGADLYELFFTWAVLSLPFALAGGWAALWALWWCVLNVALALLCGWAGVEHVFWRVLDGVGLTQASVLMLPCLVNLAGAVVFAFVASTRWAGASAPWLLRLLKSFGMAFGTAACVVVVAGSSGDRGTGQGMLVMLGFALIVLGLGWATFKRRNDVFNMALIAASLIIISTSALIKHMRFDDAGTFFLAALWLVGTSTGAGLLLMRWVRAWHAPAATGAKA